MKNASRRLDGLRIALEMERRGVSLYQRAKYCTGNDALIALAEELERDELSHQEIFMSLLEKTGEEALSAEENALLAAKAAGFFFPGGLMQVAMAGALSSPMALLEQAMEAERAAIAFYTRLTDHLQTEETELLRRIIGEEKGHLELLKQKSDAYRREEIE